MTIFIQNDMHSEWQYVVFKKGYYPEFTNYMSVFRCKSSYKSAGFMYEVNSAEIPDIIEIINILNFPFEMVDSDETFIVEFAQEVGVVVKDLRNFNET